MTKFHIERGSLLLKKLPTHVFEVPQCRPFRTNRGVCQSFQNEPIINFFNNFLNEIKIWRGYILWKNWHLMYLWPYGAGHFGYAHSCRPAKYEPIQFFLIILNLKSKIILGRFVLCKKVAVDQNWPCQYQPIGPLAWEFFFETYFLAQMDTNKISATMNTRRQTCIRPFIV